MANSDTLWVDYTTPPTAGSIFAAWLNKVNVAVFQLLGNSTGPGSAGDAPTTTAQILSNIGAIGPAALAPYAPLASPPLTGTPTAPTAALGTNTTQIATTAFVAAAGIPPLGQCRLNYTSSSTLTLTPYQGNRLMIAGVLQTIPSGGVTLVSPTMSASTLYYIYAYMNSGTMTLTASTVGHQTDTTTGVEVWTTDNTHTLVGMVYCATANTFTNTASQRYVRSWFNDPGVSGQAFLSTNRTSTSSTYSEINSEIRNNILTWAGEIILVGASGAASNNTALDYGTAAVAIDSTTAASDGYTEFQSVTASSLFPVAISTTLQGQAEGLHYVTLLGANGTGGTVTWVGNSVAPQRTTLTTFVKK